MTPRRRDDVDRIADRLADAAETFRAKRDELVRLLIEARDTMDQEIMRVQIWAEKEKLIVASGYPGRPWRDDGGDFFLPPVILNIEYEPVPDLATKFRERVAELEESKSG